MDVLVLWQFTTIKNMRDLKLRLSIDSWIKSILINKYLSKKKENKYNMSACGHDTDTYMFCGERGEVLKCRKSIMNRTKRDRESQEIIQLNISYRVYYNSIYPSMKVD